MNRCIVLTVSAGILTGIVLATAENAFLDAVRPSSSAPLLEVHDEADPNYARIGVAQQRQRLTLQHLESMWHTSLGKELENAMTSREEAFREALDEEWSFLQSSQYNALVVSDNTDTRQVQPQPPKTDLDDVPNESEPRTRHEPPINAENREHAVPALAEAVRSPFLVCTNRHPDAIRLVEKKVHHARTQLAYSRGNRSCLLAALRLTDVDAVREAAGVHFVEPLPHLAKISRSLHVEFEPRKDKRREQGADSTVSLGSKESGASTSDYRSGGTGKSGEPGAPQTYAEESLRREIRFSHGVPDDLEVTLTPGSWGIGMTNKWVDHLTTFGSTAELWNRYLRHAFLWTRKNTEMAKDDYWETAEEKKKGERVEATMTGIPSRETTMAAKHGLHDPADLWDQVVNHSSKDGACNFARLHAQVAGDEEQQTQAPGNQHRHWRPRRRRSTPDTAKSRGSSTGSARRGDVEAHDRVVLRGAGSLGREEEQNAYCLMTVMAFLATRPEVAYVDDLPKVIPMNVEAAWILQSGQETTYPVWEQNIDGRTEIIALADSGLDVSSCFFGEDDGDNVECSTYSNPVYDLTKRKVVQYVAYVDCYDYQDGHGTHVAGSAAGAISDTSPGEHIGDGMAFGAKLSVFDFGNSEGALVTPTNLQTQLLQPPYDIGARVSTNSWGAVRTTYTTLDAQLDAFAYSNPDMVILVAAGNCGDSISECNSDGEYIYGAGSILSPALAKNVITVGASEASPNSAGLADDISEVAYFSSQGPTADDNRIKPDVVAPGYHLFSAQGNPDDGETCDIGSMAGTSMATPVVAGSVALVRQYFVQGWYPTGQASPTDMFNPSNALVKAMIVASGTAMAAYDGIDTYTTLSSPPDGIQGFGRVLLDSVLNMRGTVSLYVEDSITMSHEQVHSYFIDMSDVRSSDYEGDMKVVMVWIEPYASAGSVAPVFNDLDLEVVAYDGSSEATFYPNNLASKDYDNTVEVVVISDVDSYEWFNVTVTGASVTTSSLPYYALVVTGGKAGDYSPTSATGRSWFVRWKMIIEGIPVAQAATVAFEDALAEAISFETGDYTADDSTVMVQIDEISDGELEGCSVTVEISVASESHGYAVLTYVLATVEGATSSSDQGLASALNDALVSRTTDGCECVANFIGTSTSYDCSACEEGGVFDSVQSVTAEEGDYDLLSVDGTGHTPTSVLFDGEDSSGGASSFSQKLKELLRTEAGTDVLALVVSIVGFTALCGLCVRWYYSGEDPEEGDMGGYTSVKDTPASAGGGASTKSESIFAVGRRRGRA